MLYLLSLDSPFLLPSLPIFVFKCYKFERTCRTNGEALKRTRRKNVKPNSLVLGKEREENCKKSSGKKVVGFFLKAIDFITDFGVGVFCFFWLIMRPSSCFIAFCS